jgi:hypothetical protein
VLKKYLTLVFRRCNLHHISDLQLFIQSLNYKYVKNQWMGLGASFTDARIGTTKAAIEEYGLCSNEYYQVMNEMV